MVGVTVNEGPGVGEPQGLVGIGVGPTVFTGVLGEAQKLEAGLGMDQTTLQVAKELQRAHPEICDEFTVMNLELRAGKRRVDALHNLADRTGVEDVKKLVAVLIQTDRFGTSIAQSLRGHADYLRTMARQRAEERAAKLAVKLVFPIFFCVLPSLFVVTIGPVLTRLIRDLLPMIENM